MDNYSFKEIERHFASTDVWEISVSVNAGNILGQQKKCLVNVVLNVIELDLSRYQIQSPESLVAGQQDVFQVKDRVGEILTTLVPRFCGTDQQFPLFLYSQFYCLV